MRFDPSRPWFHGSPHELDTLRAGSTITQRRKLAEAFSHKPTIVSQEDDGAIRHNGRQQGFLYRIAEPVGDDDVAPHPHTTMGPGDEWLTQRELRLELLGTVAVREGELLTAEDVAELRGRMGE